WVPFEPTPRADGTASVPIYTTPAGRIPAGQAGTTTPPTTAGAPPPPQPPPAGAPPPPNPPPRAPEPLPADNSDPLAGADTNRSLLENPVVRAGLALGLLVALAPRGKGGRNLP